MQRDVAQRGTADDEPAQVLPRSQAELDVDIGKTEVGVEQQHAAPLSRQRVRQRDGEQVLPTPPFPEAMAMVRASVMRAIQSAGARRARRVIGSNPSAAPGPTPASVNASPLLAAARSAAEAPRQIEPRRHQQAGAGRRRPAHGRWLRLGRGRQGGPARWRRGQLQPARSVPPIWAASKRRSRVSTSTGALFSQRVRARPRVTG